MSTPMRRIEVITGRERRRRWSAEQKQAIVQESLSGGGSIAAVARRHGIGTGLLYTWRHQLLRRQRPAAASFARVEFIAGSEQPTGHGHAPAGAIEIVLPGAVTVRVDAQVDEHALRRVLGVLRE